MGLLPEPTGHQLLFYWASRSSPSPPKASATLQLLMAVLKSNTSEETPLQTRFQTKNTQPSTFHTGAQLPRTPLPHTCRTQALAGAQLPLAGRWHFLCQTLSAKTLHSRNQRRTTPPNQAVSVFLHVLFVSGVSLYTQGSPCPTWVRRAPPALHWSYPGEGVKRPLLKGQIQVTSPICAALG